MDNLPLLRDIHLPEDISFFPPGYGWGIIFVVLVLVYLTYRTYKYIRLKSRKYYALKLLQNTLDNNLESVRQISVILRRICLYKYPQAAVLFGKKWIDFLNQHSRMKLKGKPAELLIYAPYLPEGKQKDVRQEQEKSLNATPQDFDLLRLFAKKWIGENL